MFGGSGESNLVVPVIIGENCFQYDANALPQLQLNGDFSVGYNVDPYNYMGNEHATVSNPPIKRLRKPEPVSGQQKLQISLNSSFAHDDASHATNKNLVSTGLRLSNQENELHSSIISAGEVMKDASPGINSLGNGLKIEIDGQKEEFDHYMKLQEANILKGIMELKQRQMASFLDLLEKGISKKLHEKNLVIESMNSKNKDLGERIKQVAIEAQTWHYRAKYNESLVNALKSNLQQLIAQGAVQAREGWGESKVDDAASYANPNHEDDPIFTKKQVICRACKGKEVSVVLIPCRHLCLCIDCEGFVDICPVCQVMKTASLQVFMS